ncbi:hypothetical protein SDC9_211495 [bioreactor metagenome]|uniref:Uncharacterized protein n=1 Tax=bioreactor metagenome TaxID=1076179 RepID=A0A645JLY4_9ZZZZ
MRDIFKLTAIGDDGVKNTRAVDVQGKIALPGEFPGLFQILARQHFSVMRVFQTEQTGAGKMDIVCFDFCCHFVQRQGAIRRGIDGLRLNAAEHRCATRFVEIVMRALTGDILFAALTMAEQCNQVRLSAGR